MAKSKRLRIHNGRADLHTISNSIHSNPRGCIPGDSRSIGADNPPCHDGPTSCFRQLVILDIPVTLNVHREMWAFRPDTLMWNALPPPIRTVDHCSMAFGNGKLYVVGGYVVRDPTAASEHGDVILMFDPSTHRWTSRKTEMLGLRMDFVVVVWNGALIVLGGENFQMTPLCTAEQYNLSDYSWTTLPSMSTPRVDFQALVYNDELIALGGESTENYLTTGEVFSFSRGTWAPFPHPMHHPRSDFGMAIDRDRLIVVGGMCDSGQIQFVEAYDFTGQFWTPLPQLPVSAVSEDDDVFMYCCAAMKDGNLFVCCDDQICVYDFVSQKWTVLPACPSFALNPFCFIIEAVDGSVL
jgi:hypothetical protein